MLRGNIVSLLAPFPSNPAPTNWIGGGSAYISFVNTNCLYANADKIQYRFKITGWQPKHTYQFSWQLTTTTTSILSTNVTVINTQMGPIEINPTGDPTQPYYYPSSAIEIDVPQIAAPEMSVTISPNSPTVPVDVTVAPPGN